MLEWYFLLCSVNFSLQKKSVALKSSWLCSIYIYCIAIIYIYRERERERVGVVDENVFSVFVFVTPDSGILGFSMWQNPRIAQEFHSTTRYSTRNRLKVPYFYKNDMDV